MTARSRPEVPDPRQLAEAVAALAAAWLRLTPTRSRATSPTPGARQC